jgi:uncharacterized membrane protein
MYRNRIIYICILACLIAPLFLTPLFLPSGSVAHLDGIMGAVDNSKAIDKLPVWARPVYLFGDVECHQMQRRSFVMNGNQMPVCARDAGIFAGFFLGAVLSLLVQPRPGEEDRAATLMRFQHKIAFEGKPNRMKLVALLFLAPLILDGGIQLLTQVMHGHGLIYFYYESNNILRLMTGILFGIPLACYLGILLTPKERPAPQRNPPSAGRSK